MSLIYLKKVHYKNEKFPLFNFDKITFINLFEIGLPATMQMLIVNISYLILTIMLNGFGLIIATVAGVEMKIVSFMVAPCWAIGQTINAMVGQNIGANKIERTRKIGITGLKINLVVTAFVVLIFQLFAGQLFMLFDSNPNVIENGIIHMRIGASWGFFAYAIMFTFDMFAAGAGNSKFGFYNSLVDALVMRVGLCWLLGFALGYGFLGIYWGNAAASVVPAIIGIWYFRFGKWDKEKLVNAQQN